MSEKDFSDIYLSIYHVGVALSRLASLYLWCKNSYNGL